MKGIPVTKAELYDANVQYVLGETYDVGKGDYRKASRECATTFCKSIQLSDQHPSSIELEIIQEKGSQTGELISRKVNILYSGRFFIVQEGDYDQTRR